MNIRSATSAEVANWDHHIISNPDGGNVFQSLEFAQQKELGGWKPQYLLADSLAITALEKTITGLGKIWYIPKGPGVTSARQLDELLPDLKDFAKKNSVFMIKIEPELIKNNETLSDLLKLGLIKTRPIQPNFSTILLDLSPNLDTIIAALNQKGRHAIKRAMRDGVTVKKVKSSDGNCRQMYQLLTDTAAGSFRIRSYNYYKSFWQRYSNASLGQLFFAYANNEVVAGAYAITFGKKSTYKDGASVRKRTTYGASHLLQWQVIQWAKENGSLVHDLCGAPPSTEINNPQHPHYGIGRFKTSFNKEVTDYIGAYDLIVTPNQYKIWTKIGERITHRLHNLIHHESFY